MSAETTVPGSCPQAPALPPFPPPRFTPEELSAMLGEKNSPTAEQSLIISSPLSPRLVIAGAGSGKTATMADRVVWLVANGWVRPEEVLGVTFTRKAAGELATRIRAKLAALQRIAAADTQNQVFPAGLLSTDALEPKVSTYHSYASGIVSDYGLRLGVERDVVLLGGAQSFQLASEVVEAFDGEYEHFRSAKSTLVKAVIQLAGECAEHLQDPAGVRGWLLDRVAEFESLPYLATAKKNPSQAAASSARCCAHGPASRRWWAATRTRSAPAAPWTSATSWPSPPVSPTRSRSPRKPNARSTRWCSWTSSRTPRTPSWSCSPGCSATATRSPPWATRTSPSTVSAAPPPASSSTSSANSRSGSPAGDSCRRRRCRRCRRNAARFAVAPTSYLTTAWRNGRNILAAANVISAPLSKAAAQTGPAGERDTAGGVEVPPLQPSPAAVQGRVVMGRFGTDEDEAAAIADDVLKFRVTDFDGVGSGA